MRPAESLIGLDLDGGWHVVNKIDSLPSANCVYLSANYVVSNKEGKKAFLKAIDYILAIKQKDPPLALANLTNAFLFERNLLNQCKGQKCDRVVIPITDGSVTIPGYEEYGTVSYIIFDLAKNDVRKEIEGWKEFDLAWVLRSMHETAIGLNQLHSIGIAHQNIKPSKILVFPEIGSKISGFGTRFP